MAPKRSNPIEHPPAASSSDEEDVTSSSSDEEEEEAEEEGSSDGEEEEEEDPKTPVTQKNPPSKKPETLAPAVAESEESGSDSESDSDTETPNVKPIATKPMEEASNAKKPRSKPMATPVKASSAKRPSESEKEPKEAKRPKKKAGEEGATATPAAVEEMKKTGEDSKKQLFQRLFTEDDEIAVLKGMLEYSEKKGSDPLADMNAFYDFVKKSIHTDVTKAQLMDKIRRLRKKFENNAGKGKKGEDRTFTKDHEQKAFKLSKMIWGEDGISGKVESSAARSNGKAKGNSKALVVSKTELPSSPVKKVEHVEPMEVDEKTSKSLGSLDSFFDKRFGVRGWEEEVLKHGLDMIGGEKKAASEKKWRELQIAELELFLQRYEFVKEHALLMLEFYKSQDK
ncbi:hypothetical protein PTKIN_Ptkin14bG0211500 [Pterospermum kingtungense]